MADSASEPASRLPSPPTVADDPSEPCRYELCYRPLSNVGPGFAFPCNASGQVALDELSTRGLNNYLRARAVVGNDLAWPTVQRRAF